MLNPNDLPESDDVFLEDLLPEIAEQVHSDLVGEIEDYFDEDFSNWRDALRQRNVREYLELDEAEREYY